MDLHVGLDRMALLPDFAVDQTVIENIPRIQLTWAVTCNIRHVLSPIEAQAGPALSERRTRPGGHARALPAVHIGTGRNRRRPLGKVFTSVTLSRGVVLLSITGATGSSADARRWRWAVGFKRILHGRERPPVRDGAHPAELASAARGHHLVVGCADWAAWEPDIGKYDFQAVRALLDDAETRRLRVILGMPLYGAPSWFLERYPEVSHPSANGLDCGVEWAILDYLHSEYRFYRQRMMRNFLSSFARHPSISRFYLPDAGQIRLPATALVKQRFEEWRTQTRSNAVDIRPEGFDTVAERYIPIRPYSKNCCDRVSAWERFQDSMRLRLTAWQRQILCEYTLRAPN